MGIEPTSQPWEGHILPMNYTRISHGCIIAEEKPNFNCFFSPIFGIFQSLPSEGRWICRKAKTVGCYTPQSA